MTNTCCCGPKPIGGLRGRTDEGLDGRSSATVSLSIAGMSCGGCARSIERLLAGVAGVEAVEVRFRDPASSPGLVRFDPTRVGADDLVAALDHAGYETRIERE
jgi:copper chaperone CopZ